MDRLLPLVEAGGGLSGLTGLVTGVELEATESESTAAKLARLEAGEKPEVLGGGPSRAADAGSEVLDLRAHLQQCDSCRRRWEGMLAHARCLAGLERLLAPVDLEGRVVAAMNAGHREDRSVRAVMCLPRLRVPAILDGEVDEVAATDEFEGLPGIGPLVDGPGGDRPGGDGLGEGGLNGLGSEATGLEFSSLERCPAPDELTRRLEREFARPARSKKALASRGTGRNNTGRNAAIGIGAAAVGTGGAVAGLSGAERRWILLSFLSVAAAILILMSAPISSWRADQNEVLPGLATGAASQFTSPERSEAGFSFRVHRVDSLQEANLDPDSARLLEALTGGLLSPL